LESAFGSLLNVFSLEETIAFLTKGRARFGIPEPEIKEGNKANLSLFTPEGKYVFTSQNILSSSKNSVFLNSTLKGKVYGIISGNNSVITE